MSEAIYHKIQLGRESTIGTGVAATTVFPVDAGFTGFELDRGVESPDEDFGGASLERAGRESYGIRGADASLPFVGRFQDLMHPLEMHVAGSVTPTGMGPYVYVYPFDETASTLKGYTVEYGDINSTQDEFRAVGVHANELEFGYDALTAPGNAPWRGSVGLMALNRVPNALTAAQVAPSTLETMEGHLTTLTYGGTGTAFGSLTALTSGLISYRFNSTLNLIRRAYGGATDVAEGYGRSGKAEVSFESMIRINATTDTNILDIFEVAGSIPTEQRWRLTIDGSGNNSCFIDARVRFRAVNIGDRDGERVYAVQGVWVYDSTLGSRGTITLTNDTASVP